MKTKEYLDKYKLTSTPPVNGQVKFNHSEFIADLTIDLLSALEVGKATENVKGFENAVRTIRQKFDAISNKVPFGLPDKLWNYFFATVIVKMKNELFPEIMAERQRVKEERQKQREEWQQEKQRFHDYFYGGRSFFDNFDFLRAILAGQSKPVKEFETLGLQTNASADDVKSAYRTLCKTHHPDAGGKQEKFVEITEAKNKLLSYLETA